MSVADSESRRFELNIRLSFLRPTLPEDLARTHDAVVVFVDRCPSRTRNLTPTLPEDLARIFFSVFFSRFGTFFVKICAHINRRRELMASIFEIHFFFGNIAFPLASVLPSQLITSRRLGVTHLMIAAPLFLSLPPNSKLSKRLKTRLLRSQP